MCGGGGEGRGEEIERERERKREKDSSLPVSSLICCSTSREAS